MLNKIVTIKLYALETSKMIKKGPLKTERSDKILFEGGILKKV